VPVLQSQLPTNGSIPMKSLKGRIQLTDLGAISYFGRAATDQSAIRSVSYQLK